MQTATLDAKFVTKQTKIMTNRRTKMFGSFFSTCKYSPIFAFKPDVLAADESAKPPPAIFVF